MRISVSPNDPGRAAYDEMREAGKTMKVYLDGNEVFDVITADEEQGYVISNRTNPNGTLFMDPEGSLVQDVERGNVEVKLVGLSSE